MGPDGIGSAGQNLGRGQVVAAGDGESPVVGRADACDERVDIGSVSAGIVVIARREQADQLPGGFFRKYLVAAQGQVPRRPVGLHQIEETGGRSGRYAAVLDLVVDGGLLPEDAFIGVVEAIGVRVVGRSLREVAELVQFVPVGHAVAVGIVAAGEVMGHESGFDRQLGGGLALGHPGGACLAGAVDAPVGEVVPVCFAVQVGGGDRGVQVEVALLDAHEADRGARYLVAHEGGVGED